MSSILRATTLVLPGHRIEVVADELHDGDQVEVIVISRRPERQNISIADFLESLPPSTRTAAEWEQFDKDFQAERDSWDR